LLKAATPNFLDGDKEGGGCSNVPGKEEHPTVHYIPPNGRGGKLLRTWFLLSDKEQVHYLVRAARLYYARPIAFTLDLSPEYQRKSSDWIRRRIVLHLETRLGRSVAVVAVRDYTADDGRPHYHGVIGAHSKDEEELIKEALCKAGGEWASRSHRRKQVKLKALYSDDYAGYMCRWYKAQAKVDWTVTNVLRAEAKEVHRMEIEKSKISPSETVHPDTQEAQVTQGFSAGSRIPARKAPPLV
jgi:hypothetical protein